MLREPNMLREQLNYVEGITYYVEGTTYYVEGTT
jgi:hypothetical protein